MNPCKKNCSCDNCKKCNIPSRAIKALEPCEVRPLPTPSFGNFFQTNFITLATNQPMPWNGVGETAGITLDPDTVTIRVTQAGAYYINYHVNGNFSPAGTGNTTISTAIFVDGVEVNPIQTRYGAFNNEVARNECEPISGGTIIFIPANGTVQLRNVGASFRTCDGGFFLASSINLIKLT